MQTIIETGFSYEIANTPGALQQITAALAAEDVNITGIYGAGVGSDGVGAFTVDDPDAAATALASIDAPVDTVELLSVSVPNEPGALNSTLQALAHAGVNVDGIFAQAEGTNLVFQVANPEKVAEILG